MNRTLLRLFFGLFIGILLVSCATAPSSINPYASLTLVKPNEVVNGYLGQTQNENPYIEPVSVLKGKTTEFVIVKLEINAPKDAYVRFAATLVNGKNEVIATLKTTEDMYAFWDVWAGDVVLNKQRTLTIKQTYLPDTYFNVKPGKNFYYAVLMGKYPLERPAALHAEMYVDGMDPVKLDAPLYDQIKSKTLGLF